MALAARLIRKILASATLSYACWPWAAQASMDVPDLAHFTSPAFCDIARWNRPASSANAVKSYHQNHNRDAASEFAAVQANATEPSTRAEAAIRQARALKAMACDDAAMAILDSEIHAPGFRAIRPGLQCLTLSRLARLTVTRQLNQAMRQAEEAKACAAAARQSDVISEALNTMAMISLSQSSCHDAGVLAQQALEQAPDPLARAEALRTRGQWRENCGHDVDAAMSDYAASEREAIGANDPEATAWARIFLSTAAMQRLAPSAGVPEKLDLAFKSARAGELRRILGAALAYHAFALAHSEYGSLLAIAVQELETSAALHAAAGHWTQERMIQIARGGYLVRLGDFSGARQAFERGRQLALDAGQPTEAAKASQGLASIARLADPPDPRLAARLMQQSLAELRGASHTPGEMARALHEAATIEAMLGDYAKASDYLRESLSFALQDRDRDAIAMSQASLGWTEWRAGNLAAANLAWRAAVKESLPEAQALGWWGLAIASRKDTPAVAAGRYARVVSVVEQMRPTGAEDAAHRSFDRRFSEAYREFEALLIDMQWYKQAQKLAVLMNRRELVEHNWTSGTRSGDDGIAVAPDIPPDPLEQCSPQIAQEERRVLADQEKLSLWSAKVPANCCAEGGSVRTSPQCSGNSSLGDYCKFRYTAGVDRTGLTRAQDDCVKAIAAKGKIDDLVRSALDDDALERWQQEVEQVRAHVVITVIDQGELRVLVGAPELKGYRSIRKPIDLGKLDKLSASLQEAWKQAADQTKAIGGGSGLAEAAGRLRDGPLRQLHQLLFDGFTPPALPAAPPPGALLIVFNDPRLRELPMAALYDGQGYLGEHYAIVHPTLHALERDKYHAGVTDSMVMGISKPDLPNVEGEVQTVAAALKTNALLNEQGTRDRLLDWLRDRPRKGLVLHLASHGQMGGTRATSLIKLWDGQVLNGDDLTDRENPPRKIQLLTLSACQTAQPGDGVMSLGLAGLAQNFASSAIGSLWNVDDRSTGRLMTSFYANWRRDPEAGVANALATAQRELMKEFAHPYFWASFIVVGRWD